MIVLYILLIIVILFALWCVYARKSFDRREEKLRNLSADVELALSGCCEILTSLLSLSKKYALNDELTFFSDIKLRRGMTFRELKSVNTRVETMSASIASVANTYLELRSNKNYITFQRQHRDARAKLRKALHLYNEQATEYNKCVNSFPTNYVANALCLPPRELFRIVEEDEIDVETETEEKKDDEIEPENQSEKEAQAVQA